MTAEELFRVLELAIHDGHGKARVLFDSEAAAFPCHMVEVTGAFLEEGVTGPNDHVISLTHRTPVCRRWAAVKE